MTPHPRILCSKSVPKSRRKYRLSRPLKKTIMTLCGHSIWLFSCSLYIPCPTRACFVYTLLTWLNFLHICPRPQLVIVLIKGEVTGLPLYRFPWYLISPPEVNSPITGTAPSLWEQRLPPCPAHLLPHTVWWCSRTLLSDMEDSHSQNHWSLCCWFQTLSLVLKLGNIGLCCRWGAAQ